MNAVPLPLGRTPRVVPTHQVGEHPYIIRRWVLFDEVCGAKSIDTVLVMMFSVRVEVGEHQYIIRRWVLFDEVCGAQSIDTVLVMKFSVRVEGVH